MGDAPSLSPDASLRLRVNVVDALMVAKGVRTVEEQARRFGLNRTHYFNIRAGKVEPTLDTALKIAGGAGTTVEALFGRSS